MNLMNKRLLLGYEITKVVSYVKIFIYCAKERMKWNFDKCDKSEW